MRPMRLFAVLLSFAALSACADATVERKYPEKVRGRYEMPSKANEAERNDKLFSGGIRFFSDDEKEAKIGVNSYLWKASLDVLSFMPLASADPFGGVIITDWHQTVPTERFKMNVLILTKTLRADGLKVTVFKQVLNKKGQWVDAPLSADAAVQTENAILTKARALYANK